MSWKPRAKSVEGKQEWKNSFPKVTFPVFQLPTKSHAIHQCIFITLLELTLN